MLDTKNNMDTLEVKVEVSRDMVSDSMSDMGLAEIIRLNTKTERAFALSVMILFQNSREIRPTMIEAPTP